MKRKKAKILFILGLIIIGISFATLKKWIFITGVVVFTISLIKFTIEEYKENKKINNFYEKNIDKIELIKGYFGIFLMTIWAILSYNKNGVWFS